MSATTEADALLERGLERLAARRPTAAISDLLAARARGVDAARVALALGHAYAIAGRWPDAEVDLARAVALAPDDTEARLAYAACLRHRGDARAAADTLLQAFMDTPLDGRVTDAATAALRANDEPGAAAQIAAFAARALGSRDPEHVHAWALAALTTGDREGARAAIERLTEVVEETPAAVLELGKLRAAIGDGDAAFVYAELAVALAPDDAEAHYFLGIMLEVVGRPDDAAAQHAHALGLAPRHWASAVRRAALLIEADQDADASALLAHAERQVGPVPAVLELRATLCERRGDHEDARIMRAVVRALSSPER